MSSTLLPFLYQTRTLQRAVRPLLLPRLVRPVHSSPRRIKRPDEDSIPFEFGPDQADAAAAAARSKQRQISTMTEAEKRVFDEIFGSITKRRRQFGAPLSGIAPNDLHADEQAGPMRSPILPGAATAETAEDKDWTREDILMMYPPALRRAAEIALGLQQETPEGEIADEQYSNIPVQVEESEDMHKLEEAKAAERAALMALHKEEKARVLAEMQACKTDIDLWELMEREVFSMVDRLGIGAPKPAEQPETNADKKKKKKQKKKKGAEAKSSVRAPPKSATADLSMDRYGPLYSMHLLSGLRHLDRGFARTSPLALAVLPRILELGMASYVLGVSTRFYNELMSIYWYRYNDSDSVMRLLREMERAGMSGDSQTLRLLDSVVESLESVAAEENAASPFAEVLGTMHEFDPITVAQLKKRRAWVLDSMREKAEELPF
ncbi:hypothetical protein jhhlp_001619 [Lomentospora prolificans]|uniref:Mtf2-like C-terminal domain-containing protein n=1 Tax=Lomentospora prolificans TaxID=41688 RepID=A0A2N3NIP0_9PEZI|nr:hypothetical protein jhhlp_001619 [Lomentospora prolificans]